MPSTDPNTQKTTRLPTPNGPPQHEEVKDPSPIDGTNSANWATLVRLPGTENRLDILDKRLTPEQLASMLDGIKACLTDLDGTAYFSHQVQTETWIAALRLRFKGSEGERLDIACEWVRDCFHEQAFNGMIEGVHELLAPLLDDSVTTEQLDSSLNKPRKQLVINAARDGRIPEVPGFMNFIRYLVKSEHITLGINTSSPKDVAVALIEEITPQLLHWAKRHHKVFRNQHNMLERFLRRIWDEPDHELHKKPFTDTYDALVHKMGLNKSQVLFQEDCPLVTRNLLKAGYGRGILVVPSGEEDVALKALVDLTPDERSRLTIVRDFTLLLPESVRK